MGSSKAPKTPDYAAQAQVQAQNDKDMAQYLTQANRVNQVDPYGQTTWSRSSSNSAESLAAQKALDDYSAQAFYLPKSAATEAKFKELKSQLEAAGGGNSQWTQTTTLNPEQQALLQQQIGIQGQQNSRISQLLTDTKTPTAPTLAAQRTLKDANQNDIQNLLYSQITKQYGDRFAQDEAAQRATLANQGFQVGSEGYATTMGDFNKNKDSAYQDAATQAALSSYDQYNKERQLNQSEYGTLAGDDLNRYGSELSGYNSQMGFLSQLLGGVQGPTNPQYQPYSAATGSQSADLVGAQQATYNADVNKANASNAQKNSTIGTVGTIAAAAAIAF